MDLVITFIIVVHSEIQQPIINASEFCSDVMISR